MAALTTNQTEAVWHGFVVEQFAGQVVTLTKDDLRAAVTAVNSWVDSNQASYVSSLSTNAANFNNAATAQQKAILLIYVLIAKYNLLSAVLR